MVYNFFFKETVIYLKNLHFSFQFLHQKIVCVVLETNLFTFRMTCCNLNDLGPGRNLNGDTIGGGESSRSVIHKGEGFLPTEMSLSLLLSSSVILFMILKNNG